MDCLQNYESKCKIAAWDASRKTCVIEGYDCERVRPLQSKSPKSGKEGFGERGGKSSLANRPSFGDGSNVVLESIVLSIELSELSLALTEFKERTQ